MRHAIIDATTMQVVNVIIWNGAKWLPPLNHMVVQNDDVQIGDIYHPQENTFSKPVN